MSQTAQPLTHEELFAYHDTGESGLGAFTAILPDPEHDVTTDIPDNFSGDERRLSDAFNGIRTGSVITINTVIQGTVTEQIDHPEDETVPDDTDAYEAYTVDPIGDTIAGQLTVYRAGKFSFSDDWKYYTTEGKSADIGHVAVDNEITPAPDTDAERYERLKAVSGPLIHFDPDSPSVLTVGTIDSWEDGEITMTGASSASSESIEITCDADSAPHSWYIPQHGADGFIIGGDNPVIRETIAYETDTEPVTTDEQDTPDDDGSSVAETAGKPETRQIPDPLGVTSQPLPEPQRDALNTIAALPAGKYCLGPERDTDNSEISLYTVVSAGPTAPTIPIQVLPTDICRSAFHSDSEYSDGWDNLTVPDLATPTPDESTVTADASLTDLTGIGPETARRIRGETTARSSQQTSKSPTDIAYVLDDDETFDSVDATMTVEELSPDEQSEAFRQAQANYTPPETDTGDSPETDAQANSKTLIDFLHTHPDMTDVASRFLPHAVADLRSAMNETTLPTGEAIQRAFTYTAIAKLVDQDGTAISNLPQLAMANDDWPSPPPAVAMSWSASTASPLPLDKCQIALVSATAIINDPVIPTADTQLAETDGQSVDSISTQWPSDTPANDDEAILVATPDSYCPQGTRLDEKTRDTHETTVPNSDSIATTQVDPGLLAYVGALFNVSITPEYLCEHARIDNNGALLISHASSYIDCWFAVTSSER